MQAEDHHWSSAKHHLLGADGPLIMAHEWLLGDDLKSYRNLMTKTDERFDDMLRLATRRGQPL